MNDISNCEMELSTTDRAILDALQRGLPVAERPFANIANDLGLDEPTVVSKVADLKRAGYIRRLGAFFSSRRLGYRGTLIALSVSENRLAAVANFVNRFPGVTHNYQREGKYQLWFTLLTLGTEEKQAVLSALAELDGVQDIMELPSEKAYKIRVALPMGEKENNSVSLPPESFAPDNEEADALAELDDLDRKLIHLLSGELPLQINPFDSLAGELNIPAAEVLTRMESYRSRRIMRRLGIVLAHRQAGYTANGLCAWQVLAELADEIGAAIAAAEPRVSHCYRRQADPAKGWPYILYTMIHGRSREEVETAAENLAARHPGLGDRVILYSVKEWKKQSLIYF